MGRVEPAGARQKLPTMPPNRKKEDPLEILHSGSISKHARKVKIEVLIRPKPKPPLLRPPPKISLLPKHDGTSYIVCRVVLPIGAVLEKDARRTMCYVVGWTDLPAAKVTIPAHQIYDYCSPRVVEDWEYQEYLKKEIQEEELLKAKERAKTRKVGGAVKQQSREARARPPRARQEAQPPPEPKLGKEDQELLEKKKLSGPSLSTPQKRKLEDFLSEDTDQDDDTAIIRQLFGDGTDFDSEATGQLHSTETDGSELDESCRASSALPPASRSRSLRSSPVRQDLSSSGPSHVQDRVPPKIHPFFWTQTQPTASMSSVVGGPRASDQSHVTQEGHKHRQTQVSSKSPSIWPKGTMNRISPDLSAGRSLHSSLTKPSQASQAKSTPVLLQAPTPMFRGKSITPIPPPALPKIGAPSRNSSYADERIRQDVSYNQTTPKAQERVQQDPQANGKHRPNLNSMANKGKLSKGSSPATVFTPVTAARHSFLQLHGRKPTIPSVKPSQDASKRSSTPNGKPSKKKRPESEPIEDDDPVAETEQQWEVKRLEGDKIFDIDGQPVRHFKVRWEGDWPPDQNPTWEPEENISRALVRKYLRKKASRGGSLSSPQQTTLTAWTKKYSSVQEAFEAGTENVPKEIPNVEDDDDEVEQLVVTEDATGHGRPHLTNKDSFDLTLARQYASFSRN